MAKSKPPQLWTEEALVDAAAAVFRGDEPETPSSRLLRLTVAPNRRSDAADKMRGFGVQIELFSREPIERIEERGRDLFLPMIFESIFQSEPFYLPVLDGTSVRGAKSAEQLRTWLCGVDLYVRESAEDRGVLLVSCIPLKPLLDQCSERLDAAGNA